MITHPIASMYPDIKRLWQQAFGDTNAWLDAYFRLRHADAHMYVTVVEEEEIASMLSLLPLDLVYDKQHFSARYLYAVATDEQWRGLGLSQTMTEQALMDVQAQGVQAVVTVPATPSLFSFYAKQGFVPFSAVQTLDLDGSSLLLPCDGSIEPCDAPHLFALRKQLLQDSPFIWGQWDIPALHYALSAAEQTGGGAYQLSICLLYTSRCV